MNLHIQTIPPLHTPSAFAVLRHRIVFPRRAGSSTSKSAACRLLLCPAPPPAAPVASHLPPFRATTASQTVGYPPLGDLSLPIVICVFRSSTP